MHTEPTARYDPARKSWAELRKMLQNSNEDTLTFLPPIQLVVLIIMLLVPPKTSTGKRQSTSIVYLERKSNLETKSY